MFMDILNLVLSLVGGAVGAYAGLRVALARLEEQMKATGQRLADHDERIKRLEGVYFGKVSQ
jgi:hypothetical protein